MRPEVDIEFCRLVVEMRVFCLCIYTNVCAVNEQESVFFAKRLFGRAGHLAGQTLGRFEREAASNGSCKLFSEYIECLCKMNFLVNACNV